MSRLLIALAVPFLLAAEPADMIIHHAKLVTLDAKSNVTEAIAIRDGRIIAVGEDGEILALQGPKTRVIDANSRMVMPGLFDSHVHPNGAALSEVGEPLPNLKSITEVLDHIKAKAATIPEGSWIVIRYAFPTRLKEARFPTKAELDSVSPRHPVLYHAGPAGIANSMALRISGVTKNSKDPPAGQIVKDETTGEPTGMLRNAYGVLKGVPGSSDKITPEQRRDAVKKLFQLYNEQGLTSISDRNASKGDFDLYQDLKAKKELSIRVTVSRGFSPSGSREDIGKRLDALNGPTGTGDDWIRLGPIKLFLDGGMLNGSAYMRQPWPRGPTYQITQDDYRGLLFIKPEQLQIVVEEAAKRKWQVTAHCAGEGAMDFLLDAYELTNRMTPITDLRYCITHANFPSQRNLERCRELGVCADVQPAWLYKDGSTLFKVLGANRMRWFQPYKSWLKYTTIGGGSDHMLRYDPFDSTNPWSPWLGIWVAVTRTLERGGIHEPSEQLTREEALRLYTINNAFLHKREQELGTLEVGKLADVIMVDRDLLTCSAGDIRSTKVLLTIVNGKIVHEKNP